MNEYIVLLQIILFSLCILGGMSILIFIFRKWDKGIDYDRIIRELNEQKDSDLDVIDVGNKEIDRLERKILDCKRKLGFKLFK